LHQLENGLGGICFAVLVGTFALSGVAAICFFIGCGILRIAPGLEIVILRLTRWEPRNLADRRKVETRLSKRQRLYECSKRAIARERAAADAADAARRECMVALDASVPCTAEREYIALRFSAKCPRCKHERKVFSIATRQCVSCSSRREATA
jgi:hypothetical protein